MKLKRGCAFILALFLVAVLILFTLAAPVGASYDVGYPAPVTPPDPWCEESALLEMPLPFWCPVIGEAVSTVAAEPESTPTPQAVKIGGRMKQKGGR